MTEKRFYIDNNGDLWDRQSKDMLMQDFGYCEAIYVNAILDLLNGLTEENTELHIQNDFLKNENQHMRKLINENKQLQERNNRQAKQLDNLYTLIEKQDWKTLTGLIQEFQESEERLRREWSDYE